MKQYDLLWVIDDDFIFRKCAEIILLDQKVASRVKLIEQPETALDLLSMSIGLQDKVPQIIFLDINMPLMTGWEFLEKAEQYNLIDPRKTKVFMLSSSVDPRDREKVLDFNIVQGFVQKPLQIENLMGVREELDNMNFL